MKHSTNSRREHYSNSLCKSESNSWKNNQSEPDQTHDSKEKKSQPTKSQLERLGWVGFVELVGLMHIPFFTKIKIIKPSKHKDQTELK